MKGSWVHRHSDDLVAGLVGAVYVGEILLIDPHPWQLLITIPLLLVAVRLRRQFPIPAMIGGVAVMIWSTQLADEFFDNGGLTFLLVWLLLHYSLGRWTAGPSAWAGPPLVLASTVLIGYEDSGSFTDTGDLAYFLSLAALPWVAGLVTRLRADHVAALHAENLRLEWEQEEAARHAVAEERSRIARELHDVVSHAISVTVLQARGARRTLGQDENQVREALDAIEKTNTAALSDMRRLLAVLRDTEDDPQQASRDSQPSLARLDSLVDQVRSSGLPVEVSVAGEPTAVPPGVDLSAYRIVQEALTNALKHAGEATASVFLHYGSHDLTVTVRDNGNGTQPGTTTGHGLIGIRERVAVVGGEVNAGSLEYGGFEVTARLPYSLEVS